MTLPLQTLVRLLFLASAAGAAQAAGVARVGPSDCRPRDADSTCAGVVAAAPAPPADAPQPDQTLYDGPLAGVPTAGYAYWGFDFIADQTGQRSPVRPDEFINRSNALVTITLSFTVPTRSTCNHDCLPGVEFELDAGWRKSDPPGVLNGDKFSVTRAIAPGQGYGWVIGLWQGTNPRLKVTVPPNSGATLSDVGLPPMPAIADEIAATQSICVCYDGSTATCSDGTRFSNGLLGMWTQNFQNYLRAGAFNTCPPER